MTKTTDVYVLGLACILFLVLFSFFNGLHGGFILDDWVHLPGLAANGGVSDWYDVAKFAFSIESGSGRPLSMVSFLLNDFSWPSVPYGFKYTNLMIHLLNTTLVFYLVYLISKQTEIKGRAWFCFFICLIWAVNPIQISAVFLVIQRMTLLSATFVLSGIVAYLKIKHAFYSSDSKKHGVIGLFLLGICFFWGTILGVLAKETAILFPVFIFVYESTISPQPLWRVKPFGVFMTGVYIALPIFALLAYLVWMSMKPDLYQLREFGMADRVLTEGRVLGDYLKRSVLLLLSGSGPYQDDYQVSGGWFNPISTLLWWIFHCLLISVAFLLRRRKPLIAFGILWFYGGHLLESTVLPLELYFEHRNYLPFLGVSIVLFEISRLVLGIVSEKLLKVCKVLFIIYTGFILFQTYQQSLLWGQEGVMVNIWASEHPGSVRAQFALAGYLGRMGERDLQASVLDKANNLHANNSAISLGTWLDQNCHSEAVVNTTDIAALLKTTKFSYGMTEYLNKMFKSIDNGFCESLNFSHLRILVKALLENPRYVRVTLVHASLWESLAEIAYSERDLNVVMTSLDRSYDINPMARTRFSQVHYLNSAGLSEDAYNYWCSAIETKPGSVSDWIDRIQYMAIFMEAYGYPDSCD